MTTPLTDADIDRIADAVPIDTIGVHITTWHRRFARAVLAAQPLHEQLREMGEAHAAQPAPAEPVEYQICLQGGRWTHCAKHIYESGKSCGATVRALYEHPATQPAPVPACPVCQNEPTWSHDARVGEWEGRCLHCGIDGPVGQTLDSAKAKWADWYGKAAQPAPVSDEVLDSLGMHDAAVKLARKLGYSWIGGEWTAQPAHAEPVACLIRYRGCTPARAARDGQRHWHDWSDWQVATLEHGQAVTHPARNPTEDGEWQMQLLYRHPPAQPAPVPVARVIFNNSDDDLGSIEWLVRPASVELKGGDLLYTHPAAPVPVPLTVPAKMPPHEWSGDHPSGDSYNEGYADGWNDCVDAIAASPEKP